MNNVSQFSMNFLTKKKIFLFMKDWKNYKKQGVEEI